MYATIQMVDGRRFPIKVEFFDTVLQMKQKIQNFIGVQPSDQVLFFEGKPPLDDARSVSSCLIRPGSCVQLLHKDQYNPAMPPPGPPPLPPISAKLMVRVPIAESCYSLDDIYIDLTDTVLQLKQILHQIYGFPIDRLGLYVSGRHELTGNQRLSECGILQGSVIDVFFRPVEHASNSLTSNNYRPLLTSSSPGTRNMQPLPPLSVSATRNMLPLLESSSPASGNMPPLPPCSSSAHRNILPLLASRSSASRDTQQLLPSSPSAHQNMPPLPPSSSSSPNRLRIQVLTPCKKRLPIEVDPAWKVQMLRDEVEKHKQRLNLELSLDGYFFRHKQNPMCEGQSFLWHVIDQDDEIQIFNRPVNYASDTNIMMRR